MGVLQNLFPAFTAACSLWLDLQSRAAWGAAAPPAREAREAAPPFAGARRELPATA